MARAEGHGVGFQARSCALARQRPPSTHDDFVFMILLACREGNQIAKPLGNTVILQPQLVSGRLR